MDRIVVTGYGVKVPGALSKNEFREVLEKGICTHSTLAGMGKNGEDVVAGVIHDEFMVLGERNYKRYPRFTRMAIAAARDAVEMAGVSGAPHRIGVVMGSTGGAIMDIERFSDHGYNLKKFPLHGVSLVDTHTLSSSIAENIGVNGPAYTLSTGCTSSLDAVVMAKLLLESGQVDACMVGGADSVLGQWNLNGFYKIRSVESGLEWDETGVPFSDEHQGFVMSEGAGVLVLEREQDALRAGKKIYGRIVNVVSRNEGRPMLKSDESGEQMLEVYRETVGSSVPCYVNSQALGLKVNDHIEQYIHTTLFGSEVPITSIKGMIGHTFGATGAIQMISSLISMEYGFIPPTIKTKGRGYEDLTIPFTPKYQPVSFVTITNHGHSGNNACLFLST